MASNRRPAMFCGHGDGERAADRCGRGGGGARRRHRDAQVDRQAVGVLTDFASWRTEPAPALDALFEAIPARGNVGDRDALAFEGFDFAVYEAQLEADDWSTWRTYLHDPSAGRIDALPMRTHGGSRAFGNPSVSAVTAPDGSPALVVTQFLFHEGAAPGEAGELLYVVPLDAEG
jgi:hypothetical protein